MPNRNHQPIHLVVFIGCGQLKTTQIYQRNVIHNLRVMNQLNQMQTRAGPLRVKHADLDLPLTVTGQRKSNVR